MDRSTLLDELHDYKKNNGGKYGILEIGIFGSFARNQQAQSSDVDIVVKMKSPDPYLLVHIKEELESQLHLPVDIVRMRDTMNHYLKNRIEAEALYAQ